MCSKSFQKEFNVVLVVHSCMKHFVDMIRYVVLYASL